MTAAGSCGGERTEWRSRVDAPAVVVYQERSKAVVWMALDEAVDDPVRS